jgi:excisionase family DNA binding protein
MITIKKEAECREMKSEIKNEAEFSFTSGNRLCISVPEAAMMLGISRNHAYELVKQHKLPIIKLGKRLLIPRVALQKMLEGSSIL